MNKKLMIFLCLLIALTAWVIAWAGDKSQTTDNSSVKSTAPVEKVSFSTDLGKGMPYPGFSDAEKAKLAESSKTQQPVPTTTTTATNVNLYKAKEALIPITTPSTLSITPPPDNSHVKPLPANANLGKDTPYSGLSPLEKEKLQNERSK